MPGLVPRRCKGLVQEFAQPPAVQGGAVRAGAELPEKAPDLPVVAADDTVEPEVERLRLVDLKEFRRQRDEAGLRLGPGGWQGGYPVNSPLNAGCS